MWLLCSHQRCIRRRCTQRLRPPRWQDLYLVGTVDPGTRFPSRASCITASAAALMPPHARQAQGQEPAAATIGSLSDDLLAACFSLLEQADL